jgi:hypothetical protein
VERNVKVGGVPYSKIPSIFDHVVRNSSIIESYYHYAIKAARAAALEGEGESAGRLECRWQRDQLPEAIRELVRDDQRLRNDICWSVFDC